MSQQLSGSGNATLCPCPPAALSSYAANCAARVVSLAAAR